jgi:hypothetical protein
MPSDPIAWAVDEPGLRLGLGNSSLYRGAADFVFSHLYGPLPDQLKDRPALVNLFGNKKDAAERWCGQQLHEVSKWATGLTNTLYANFDCPKVDLRHLVEEEFEPGRGWFPLELALAGVQIGMAALGRREFVVFDGFMGRGTVGAAVRAAGLGFVGIDIDPNRVVIAKEYLGC